MVTLSSGNIGLQSPDPRPFKWHCRGASVLQMTPHELAETDFRKTRQSRENQRAFVQPALKERRADPESLV
ncbi:hypothetical protein GCM10007315_07140 [Gemmobacter tilapiae]|uniref:Uncharacterized protein n=1 Tax=Neogemmobacter tilapiae TaxID=875041 RepID=A0A918WFZ4_9RHOB|nr:hypothetical protein GCM10007315_07140 [Gemmobacter tilapiae]